MGFLDDFQKEYQKQSQQQAQFQPGSPEFKRMARLAGGIAFLVGIGFAVGCFLSWRSVGAIPTVTLVFALSLPPLGLYSLITGRFLGR